MIVKRVKVVDQLLIVLHRDVGLGLLDVGNLSFITRELLLYFLDDSLVVLYLNLDVFVRDSLSWVNLGLCLLHL